MQWQEYRQRKDSVASPFFQNDEDPSFWREAQVEHFQVASRAATAAGSWYQRLALFDWRPKLNDFDRTNCFHSKVDAPGNFPVINLYFRFPLEWLLLCHRNISAVSSWSTWMCGWDPECMNLRSIPDPESLDNMKKSLLITPVPLSFGSQLEWVGFNVVSGKFFHI